MNVAFTVLLALPAANPTPTVPYYRYDGDWTIVSVEHNGKTTEAKAPVTIKQHRLVLNEGKGEQITVEFDANNRSWLWAGKNKPPTTPPPPEMVPLIVPGATHFWMPGGEMWIVEPLSRMPMPAPLVAVPARYTTLATPGFYLPVKDQLQVFFLPIGGEGPTLTLVLQRK